MLRGDLGSNPLRQLLPELAADTPTGCLYVADPEGGELHLYLDGGHLCGVRLSPERDPLGERLVASGWLRPDEVATYRPTDDRAPTLAEQLIEAARLPRDEIDRLALELALDSIDVACGWSAGAFRFRRRQRSVLGLPDPIAVDQLLADLDERGRERRRLAAELSVEGVLGAATPRAEDIASELPNPSATSVAVLALVDGTRSIDEIGRSSGHSDLAVARLLLAVRPVPQEPAASQAADDHDAVDDEATSPGAWNRLADEAEVAESLAKVSPAVSEALGDLIEEVEPDTSSVLIRPPATRSAVPAQVVDPETKARRERVRAAAAAELAAAHAEAEEDRRALESATRPAQRMPSADVVDLTARREASRAARAADEARLAAEALAAEGARLAEEAQLAAEAWLTEEARLAEEAQLAEEARLAERARRAEALPIRPEDPLGLSPEPTQTAEPEPEPEPQPEPLPAPPSARPWAQSSGDQHLAATALLREMAGNGSQARTPTAAVPVPSPEPADTSRADSPRAGVQRADTARAARLQRPTGGAEADTAALLRELSSLGDDEATPRSAPVGASSRPSPVNSAPPRKRKGLWGRG